MDVAEANGTPYIGIASMGFDSVANKLANETRMVRGNLVYLYAGISALASWEPAAFEVEVDGASTSVRGYTVAVANSKAYGGGMFIAPQAELDDGLLDVVVIGEIPKLRFLRGMPTVFKGEHLGRPGVSVLRGERVRVSSDREFDVYADGDPIARTPVDLTVERGCLRVIAPEAGRGGRPIARDALARLVRAVSRRLGRTGGTTAPGRLLLRLSPGSLGSMSRELDDGAVLISATNGKTTTAAMVAAILERDGRPVVHNRAGSNMAWGVATALLDAARGRGQLGLFEVDEAWLGQVAERSSRASCCCRTCSATSSTATASWSCWRTAGPRWSPRTPAGRASC